MRLPQQGSHQRCLSAASAWLLPLILLTAAACAQDSPSPAEVSANRIITTLTDPKALASALYQADYADSPEVAAALSRAILVAAANPHDDIRRCLIDLALDALITAHAQITADALDAVLADPGMQQIALIDMAFKPTLYLPQLQRLCQSPDEREIWVLASEEALAAHAPFLAKILLQHVQQTVTVSVYDANMRSGGGRKRASVISGDGVLAVPPGFPGDVRYTLVFSPEIGDAVVAQGPQPVYAHRDAFRVKSSWVPGRIEAVVLNDLYAQELQALSAIGSLWTAQQHEVMQWTIELEYRTAIMQLLEARAKAYQELLSKLVEEKLLSDEDAHQLPMQLTCEVYDYRVAHLMPLPRLPGVTVISPPPATHAPSANPQ